MLAKEDDVEQHFSVNCRFDVKATSEAAANAKVESTMKNVARLMGWEEPDKLERLEGKES
jgi:hypothetical protein